MASIVQAVSPLIILLALMAAGLSVEWAVGVLVVLALFKIAVIAIEEARAPSTRSRTRRALMDRDSRMS